jgi:glycosyltransferase
LRISIITPSYNSGNTIKSCLGSIQHQTYKNVEHILIDGGSEDNTIRIAHTYPHLSKIVSEPDQGIYDAMNKGIKLSNGDIIGILNSDDVYLSQDVIHSVINRFKNNKVDAVYGDLNYINENNKIIRRWRSGEYSRDLFLQGWMPPHPTFFIRKEYYDRYGLYNTDFSISADYELMLRMLYRYKLNCVYIPEVLVSMRTGGHSNSSWRKRWTANKEDRKAWVINGLKPKTLTLWKKPLYKLIQYI